MLTALILTLALGVIWIGLLAGGAFVTWRGLRGRQVDNLPRCRTCGYNVGGRPHRVYRCPECGANLQLLGSVRLGRRAMHGPRVTLGASLVLAGLSPIGFLLWRAMPPAVPVAVAAPARPVLATPRSGWNPAAAARAERRARARLDAGFTTSPSTVDVKTLGVPPSSAVTVAGPFDPSDFREFVTGPPESALPAGEAWRFSSYGASAGPGPLPVDARPKTPVGPEEPADRPASEPFAERSAQSTWPTIAAGSGSNPFGSNLFGSNPSGSTPSGSTPYGPTPYGPTPWGGFGTGAVFGGGSAFATRSPRSVSLLASPGAGSLMTGRLVQPRVMLGGGLAGFASGGYGLDGRSTGTSRIGGSQRALDANGLPTALPNALPSGYRGGGVPSPGLGNGPPLGLPVPVTPGLPGMPPG